MTATDYNDPKEVRMSAEAFDWLEREMPEIKDLILSKFAPRSSASSIGCAIIVADIARHGSGHRSAARLIASLHP